MKKLISFVVLLCMLLPVTLFTSSCESGAGIEQIAHRRAATVVIHFIVEDGTTPEALAEVEEALSRITEGRFTTRLRLVGLTADEYHEAIERAFANFDEEVAAAEELASILRSSERASRDQAREDRAANIPTVRTQRPTRAPETTALFTQRIEWPDVRREQMDIFLITSPEMFAELLEDGRLEPLDDELSTRAKILNEYIHPSTMMAGQHNGRSFAIPTNRIIGEGVYLAINTRLAEEHGLDVSRVQDARALTDWLAEVQANEPGIALFDGGPQYPMGYEPVFPEFPHFPIQANAGRSLVFTPTQMPTEPTEPLPTEPPTDEYGELIVEDEPEETTESLETTIPATTLPPRPTPQVTNTYPDPIVVLNQYTAAIWGAFARLNDEWRERGFFASNVAPEAERAAFMFRGTLEDKLAQQAMDEYLGFEYEYILIVPPRAEREQLQSAMFGISVASPNVVGRVMEIVTLLNTNREFKNIFTYGIEGEHFIYNDYRQIERVSYDYMVNIDFTGNHFIADLLAGENPRRWDIAKEHNLGIANSVFLNFNLQTERFSDEIIASKPGLQALGLEVRNAFLHGLPAGFEDWDEYILEFVTPSFAEAGAAELLTAIREQTSPE